MVITYQKVRGIRVCYLCIALSVTPGATVIANVWYIFPLVVSYSY